MKPMKYASQPYHHPVVNVWFQSAGTISVVTGGGVLSMKGFNKSIATHVIKKETLTANLTLLLHGEIKKCLGEVQTA